MSERIAGPETAQPAGIPDPAEFAARIPAGFTVGTATAAFQIEGGVDEGGRGRSGWDEFSERPGTILDGSDARVAADHYHRYPEDVGLLRDLGADAYRFSLSWPRIQPGGTGPANQAGIDFYDRLIDELLEAGIKPVVTLFHWDTPLELERRGGWLKRDTAYRFAEYAAIAGRAFGDRVESWITINEPATVTLEGYALDVHAPAASRMFGAIPVASHLLLGHGLAVRALRDVPVAGRIGITNVHTAVVPATDSRRNRAYAQVFDYLHNRIFADPVLLGRMPPTPRGAGPISVALKMFSRTRRSDLRIMAEPIDFYGLNYYFPSRVALGPPPLDRSLPDGESRAMRTVPFHLAEWPDRETTGFGWAVAPDYLRTVFEQLAERYGDALPPVIITEGGASYPDEPGPDGTVDDAERVAYLAEHLAVAMAGAPGVDVQGYFVWTLLDNFEWAAGYTQRFGLVYVDFDTLQRTPKRSFHWLREVLAARPDRGRD